MVGKDSNGWKSVSRTALWCRALLCDISCGKEGNLLHLCQLLQGMCFHVYMTGHDLQSAASLGLQACKFLPVSRLLIQLCIADATLNDVSHSIQALIRSLRASQSQLQPSPKQAQRSAPSSTWVEIAGADAQS